MNFKKFLLFEGTSLLLEYKDWLAQRTKAYGAWVDTKANKIHYVIGKYGHNEYVKKYLAKQNETTNNTYRWAFQSGWVRFVFENTLLSVEGNKPDIEKIGVMIMSTLNSPPQIRKVNIEVVNPDDLKDFKLFYFEIPKDRYKLGQFLGID